MSEYIIKPADWAIDYKGESLYKGCEEIVRCRDCAYICNREYANGLEYHTCSYFDSEHAEVELDGFCAWGERKQKTSTGLRPCPFCGGEARGAHENYGDTHYWRVYCDTIGCAFGISKVFHSEAEAIAAWNARVGSHCAFAQPTDLTDGCALLTERTCKNVCREWEKTSFAHAATSFCCSECGAHYVDCESYYAGLADADGEQIRTNYCPNCGAKVVKNEQS